MFMLVMITRGDWPSSRHLAILHNKFI